VIPLSNVGIIWQQSLHYVHAYPKPDCNSYSVYQELTRSRAIYIQWKEAPLQIWNALCKLSLRILQVFPEWLFHS